MIVGSIRDAAKAFASCNEGLLAGVVICAVAANNTGQAEVGASFKEPVTREALETMLICLRTALEKVEADLAALNAKQGN